MNAVKFGDGARRFQYFALMLALVACGGDGEGDGGGPPPPTSDVPRFAYVANSNDNTVSIYTVNASTGQLRANGYVAAGTQPSAIAVDPSGKFAYVANGQSASVSAYSINITTGVLSEVPGSPFDAGVDPFSVTTTRKIR